MDERRDSVSGLRAFLPGTGGRVRSTHRRLAWLFAPLLPLLVVGVSVARANTGWIEWAGTVPVSLSEGLSAQPHSWQPVVAAGPSGRLVVAWSDRESGAVPRDIYFVLSNDYGRTWPASPQVISQTAKYSALPDALFVEDRAFVAWVDQATEAGLPVALYEAEVGTEAVRSIPNPLSWVSTLPRLAASPGRLHVVFNAGDPPHILYATRALTETAWPTATVIYTSTVSPGSLFPMLAVDPDGETLHVAWWELKYDGQVIRYVRYMRWGPEGADVCTLSEEAPTADTVWGSPTIAVDSSGNPHVAWEEEVGTGPPESRDRYIRYTRYDVDSGWTTPERIYSEPVRVNADDPRNILPSLALMEKEGDEMLVCVGWHGFQFQEDDLANAEEVLLSCSEDGGLSWLPPRNVSRSPGGVDIVSGEILFPDVSIVPSIVFDEAGQLHSAWQERVDSVSAVPYYEIYYAHALGKQTFLPLVTRR